MTPFTWSVSRATVQLFPPRRPATESASSEVVIVVVVLSTDKVSTCCCLRILLLLLQLLLWLQDRLQRVWTWSCWSSPTALAAGAAAAGCDAWADGSFFLVKISIKNSRIKWKKTQREKHVNLTWNNINALMIVVEWLIKKVLELLHTLVSKLRHHSVWYRRRRKKNQAKAEPRSVLFEGCWRVGHGRRWLIVFHVLGQSYMVVERGCDNNNCD